MKTLIGGVLVLSMVLLGAACSDDTEVKPDQKVVTKDAAPDLPGKKDSAVDQKVADQKVPDAAQGDMGDPCANGTGTGTVKGTVVAKATLTCGTTAADDCKGTMQVAVVCVPNPANPGVFIPKGGIAIKPADISASGVVSYEIPNVPAGKWLVTAFLDENDTTKFPPSPAKGDPWDTDFWKPVEVTDGQTTTAPEIDLDGRCGPPVCN